MTQQLFAAILTAVFAACSVLCYRKNEDVYDNICVPLVVGALAGFLWLLCDFGSSLPHGTWWVK